MTAKTKTKEPKANQGQKDDGLARPVNTPEDKAPTVADCAIEAPAKDLTIEEQLAASRALHEHDMQVWAQEKKALQALVSEDSDPKAEAKKVASALELLDAEDWHLLGLIWDGANLGVGSTKYVPSQVRIGDLLRLVNFHPLAKAQLAVQEGTPPQNGTAG